MNTRSILIGATTICFLLTPTASAAISSGSPSTATGEILVATALFGSGTKVANVTKRVVELLHSDPDGFSARADWLRADPIPYKSKALVIAYDYKGKHRLFVTPAGERVSYKLLVANAER